MIRITKTLFVDLGKIDTYIHLREDNGTEPFHQFGLELDVMEVRFDYMSTSVLMGRVSHLLLKVRLFDFYFSCRIELALGTIFFLRPLQS